MRRSILGIVLALLCVGSVAPASADGSPTPVEWREVRKAAFSKVASLRAAIEPGSLGAALRGTAAIVDLRPSASPSAGSPVKGLPPDLAVAVGELLASIERAGAAAEGSLRAEPRQIEAHVARLDREIARSRGLLGAGSRVRRLERLQGLEHLVDRERLYGAAIRLADEIDRALELAADMHGIPTNVPTAGCEIVDQPPALCVGGLGANTYTEDYALVLDLGGDDLHAHSAGSADAQGNGLPASVTLDLGGNDRYETTVPSPSGARGVQGSGYVGGIGFLVDVAGNDVYRATTDTPVVQALGQGLAVAGVGVLADLTGNDDYGIANVAVAAPDNSYNERANGQSYALIGGMSLVLEPAGDDRYLIETHPAPLVDPAGALHPGNPITLGFGYSALSGPAVFADLSGNDSASLRSRTQQVSAADARALEAPSGTVGGVGLGGLGGAGISLTGPGSMTWSFDVEVEAPTTGLASAGGGGYALLGGFGALDDAGGADVYRSTAISRARADRAIDDSCSCGGVTSTATSAGAMASIGPIGLAGVALVNEGGGADRYEMRAVGSAIASATDGRTLPPEPGSPVTGASATADLGTVATSGMGAGDLASAAFFLDSGASPDTYLALSDADASAEATSELDGVPTEETTMLGAAQGEVFGIGLINGYGEFVDLGGADSFTVANTATADGFPLDAAITSAMGSVRSGGGSFATFADLDGGAVDTVSLVPGDAVCAGEDRASGRYWQDCEGPAVGIRA